MIIVPGRVVAGRKSWCWSRIERSHDLQVAGAGGGKRGREGEGGGERGGGERNRVREKQRETQKDTHTQRRGGEIDLCMGF